MKAPPALPPKADMCGAARDVRFGPIADIGISKKVLCRIVKCNTKRHDCADSIAGEGDDYHSRIGVGSFGVSPRSANGSPVWFDGPRVNKNCSFRPKTC